MILRIRELIVRYQKVSAIKGISIDVPEGKIVTLIGSNGAGKTTILRTISGLNIPSNGEIWFKEKRIDRLSPDKILQLGIAHVPEGRRIFPGLTVLENLYLGAFIRSDKKEIEKDLERIFSHFPVLMDRRKQIAGTLSGGQQQMLAIGRALMAKPRILLLDEPSLGLAPLVIKEISKIIKTINENGVSVVLVEQNADLALKLSHNAYVLETGQVALDGSSEALMNNDHVRRAYLGI